MKESHNRVVAVRVIYFTSIITICSLYAAQPIQPLFQDNFQLTSQQALLFTTLMMFPLGIAPLFYGLVLQSISAKQLLRVAVLGLGLLEFVFASSQSYITLLTTRALQGLLIPAILTSLMSYISSTSEKEEVQHAVAVYIGSTIVGGFLGRFLSGLSTEIFGWRFFFVLLGCLFILAFFLLNNLEKNENARYAKLNLHVVTELLGKRDFFWLYATIFSLFFVFSAIMNILPFALRVIEPSAGEAGVGFLYSGYAMGIIVSINTRRLIKFFGGEVRAVLAAIVIFFIGISLFYIDSYRMIFGAMFIFCAGLFMAHSLLSGFINKMADDNKSMANGLYISFYYMGGSLGSFLPGYVFASFGWHGVLLSLQIILIFSLFCLSMIGRARSGSGRSC